MRDLGLETAQPKGTSQSYSQVPSGLCVQEVHVSMPPGHRSLTLACSLTVMVISAVCFVLTLWTVCTEPGNLLIILITAAGSFTEGPVKGHHFLSCNGELGILPIFAVAPSARVFKMTQFLKFLIC